MNRALFTAALLFTLQAEPLAAQAPGRPSAPPSQEERKQRGFERMAGRLKLTDAQKASFKVIHEKHRAVAKARRETARTATKAFHEAVKDPAISNEQLRRFHQAMADARFEALSAQRAMRMETRALLSPEQREQAAELRGMAQARRHDRIMRRHGRGPGMGPGRGEGPGPDDRRGGRPGFEG